MREVFFRIRIWGALACVWRQAREFFWPGRSIATTPIAPDDDENSVFEIHQGATGHEPKLEPEQQAAEPPVASERKEHTILGPVGDGVLWYEKRDLMEVLAEYHRCMRLFLRLDPDGFDGFANVGCVIPDKYCRPSAEGYSVVNGEMFMRGAVAIPLPRKGGLAKSLDDKCSGFVFLTKMERSARAFTNRGQIYRVLMACMDKSEHYWAGEYHVVILPGGKVELLGEQKISEQRVRSKAAPGRGGPQTSTVYHRAWGIPDWVIEFARDAGKTPQQYGAELFLLAFHTYREAGLTQDNAVFVRVSRGATSGNLALPLTRCKHFFRDRSRRLMARDGKRKRIFHYVEEHARLNGAKVQAHFRGIRKFDWNGYDIHIIPPGRQAALTSEGPAASDDLVMTPDEIRRTIDAREASKMIDAYLVQ